MKKTTSADVLQMVQDNHIWLNAFSCINPTDEFLRDIGKMVLDKLSRRDNLLPMYLDDEPPSETDSGKAIQGLAEITKVLYLSVNKS